MAGRRGMVCEIVRDMLEARPRTELELLLQAENFLLLWESFGNFDKEKGGQSCTLERQV